MDITTRTPELYRTLRGHAFYPTAAQLTQIPALYATEDTPLEHKTLHLHYFASWGDWYVAELDPATGKAFGWARIGMDDLMGEWGYIHLPDLESTRATRGLPNLIERDLDFTPQVAATALPRGHRVHACRDENCGICPR